MSGPVLVDTSVWSLAFRRRAGGLSETEGAIVAELASFLENGQAALVGAVRQELLTGLRSPAAFETLRTRLDVVPVIEVKLDDHDRAASIANACRAAGVATTPVDTLLCAVAVGRGIPLWTIDRDFALMSAVVPLPLWPA